MESEWKKEAKKRLQEREREACNIYVTNLPFTEKEREVALENCTDNVAKLPLEERIKFIQEIGECETEALKAPTSKGEKGFREWCYAGISVKTVESSTSLLADLPTNIHLPKLAEPFGAPKPARIYVCDQLKEDGTPCGFSAGTKQELNRHIDRVHWKLKPFICDQLKEDGTPCGYSAASSSDLQKHIDRVHRKSKPFVCNEFKEDGTPCGYSAATKDDLRSHIYRIHGKLKPFVCNELKEDGTPCGYSAATKVELNRHIDRVHRKVKPFVCNEILENGQPCEYSSVTKAELDTHINRVHRKLRPFICNELKEDGQICGLPFATKGELKRHIDQVHRKLRPFICDEFKEDGKPCGQSFLRKSSLEMHIREHHEKGLIKAYCSKCGKAFKQKRIRDRHEVSCSGVSDEKLKSKYHVKKGASVEDVVVGIIEQYCESLNIPTTKQKELVHPTLGIGKIDLYCDGLEGKRIAVDVTTSNWKQVIMGKWTQKRYQEYPGVDELWVVVCSNIFDGKRCAELTDGAHRNSQYQNVYIYHWTDLRNIKMMTIPPKIWKLLEIYEMCTLQNKEECKKYWEEAKERFYTF